MTTHSFPAEVRDQVKHYVYRLVDPRNGETFYVGRGTNDRVFHHAAGDFGEIDEGAATDKHERINEIRVAGFEVQHIIHRHGMNPHTAKEVEAALIDAYPGLTNLIKGAGVDRGTRHADEVVRQYKADEFKLLDPLMLICINKSWRDLGVYRGVQGIWKVNIQRARRYPMVLAHVSGIIVGAFEPERWLPGSKQDFPQFHGDETLWGFVGHEARIELKQRYLHKKVPAEFRKKGAMTSVKYLDPPNLNNTIVQYKRSRR